MPGKRKAQGVIAIVGPTAVGKSGLAMRLAADLGGEIVNADALQVYRGFDIGTAKPSLEERREVPHHLIDILDPHERYSAGEFRRRALAVIEDIQDRGRRALVVGGSGLYLRALFEGISPIPAADPEVRRRYRDRLVAEGIAALHAELGRIDPATARRLAPADTQRVLRALEVAETTGLPLSSWIDAHPFGREALPSVRIGLTMARGILYDRILGRAAGMLDRGWVDEVRTLIGAGISTDLPAFQAIGYRQITGYLRGECSLQEAVDELTKATRHFAKRQETWFRKEPRLVWFEAENLNGIYPRIRDYLDDQCAGRANA